MLHGLRVLDLTDERGQVCGQILADLGADVIVIEPPGGSSARRLGPFADGQRDGEHSLWWWSFNRGKRSVVLDLQTSAGRQSLLELAHTADFLVQSAPVGAMDALGLGYEALEAVNPRLIYLSISPFGQDGPKAHWAANDLTVMASSGALQITGDDDRAPTRVAVPQAFLHAGAEAAVGALIAHEARERDGRGQHIDVSAQAAAAMATQSMILCHGWNEQEVQRLAGGLKVGPIKLRLINPCKDGYVSVTFLFGTAIGPFSRRLMEVMCEKGFVDEATRDKDWIGYTGMLLSGQEPLSELERCIDCVSEFTKAHTKAELFDLALEHGLLIVPVTTTADVVHSPQLEDRRYWTDVKHEDGRRVTYPGPFAKFSATPITYGAAAPRPGAHTAEVLGERREPPATVPGGQRASAALDGLKVLDLMWVMAGPAATRYLADYGATVVRVESTRHVDTARTIQPFKDGTPGPERSGLFAAMNAGKLGLTLNPGCPEGREVVLDLVRWADVVTESFSPKAMRTWGLDYESLKAVNPSVILISSCLNGHSGPHAKLAGFGTMGAQLAGFGELAGWPDRPPAGPFGAYTDYVSPKYTAAAILAALEHRRRTGEGQYIDLSQSEASLHFLGPAFLDYTVNGHVMSRNGNASPEWAPHAVFPAAGEDRWVAVAAEGEEQWRALCGAIGQPGLAADARFATNDARLANRDALEEIIAEWTRERSVDEIEDTLQARGIPCHRSATSVDSFADPQLQHRGHFVVVEHPELGPVPLEGSRMRFSATPGGPRSAGPTFGQHNEQILRDILGYDDDRVVELITSGALE